MSALRVSQAPHEAAPARANKGPVQDEEAFRLQAEQEQVIDWEIIIGHSDGVDWEYGHREKTIAELFHA